MKEQIEEYIAQRKAEGMADATLSCDKQRLGRLLEFMHKKGVRRWQNARPQHVDGYLDFLERSGLSFFSREGFVITARCFLRWLAERGRILSDPTRHLDLPRPDKDELPLLEPPLSEQEVSELLSALPRRNAVDLRNIAYIELLYSAGLRLSESLSLDLRDIDFSNRIVHVRKGKGSKQRDIPMMRGLQGTLRDYVCLRRSLLKGPDHGALLLGRTGKRLSKGSVDQFMNSLNKVRVRSRQRHVHAHLFRHSIAVHLLRGGADIRYIQAFLGHEDLESTKIYLRLVPADLRKAYDAAMPEIGRYTLGVLVEVGSRRAHDWARTSAK